MRRLVPGYNARWEITVTAVLGTPTVTLALLNATTKCSAEGAICNVRNGKLSSALEFTVSGPEPGRPSSRPCCK